MRFVLFDDDEMFRSIAEETVIRLGHEVAGIADSALSCVGLIESSKPDGLILDFSSGIHTDFDVVETANAFETSVIIFSFLVDDALLNRYDPRPVVVPKPDTAELERAIERIGLQRGGSGEHGERRRHPTREAKGPPPTGITDAQAFFEAVNNAVEGDTLMSIEPPDGVGVSEAGLRLAAMIRQTDRLLAAGASIKVLLPEDHADSKPSLLERLERGVHVPHGTHVRTVVVGPGETGADAFDRLKHGAEVHEL